MKKTMMLLLSVVMAVLCVPGFASAQTTNPDTSLNGYTARDRINATPVLPNTANNLANDNRMNNSALLPDTSNYNTRNYRTNANDNGRLRTDNLRVNNIDNNPNQNQALYRPNIRANAAGTTNDNADWGWLGLLGLVGLAGLWGRNRTEADR